MYEEEEKERKAEVARVLLEEGADPNIRYEEEEKEEGKVEVARVLLEEGADPYIR